ncbi:MAG TPA: TonB family protein [Allosphingosinicella sp.]|nr:TonB family protein [Allosphingosinicella sp.]
MVIDRPSANRRVIAALAAVALEGVLGLALILGFAVTMPARHAETLKLFSIAPPPPPVPPVTPPRITSSRPEGAASPPNLRARATEIVAPVPPIPLPLPPPVVAAPVAGPGNDPSAGSADVPGPGTGSGGWGTGTGSGRGGDGDGGGGGARGGRGHTPPRWLRGRLTDSDFPAAAAETGAGGTVTVRFTVETDGRIGRCVITRSSGNDELDHTTCRLIVQRYRYRPSLDPYGRPVRSLVEEDHDWAYPE